MHLTITTHFSVKNERKNEPLTQNIYLLHTQNRSY